MIRLRSYQTEMTAQGRAFARDGKRRVIFVLPTGGGKRIMAAAWISRAIGLGKRAWFLVHRQELLDQSADTLEEFRIPFGRIKAGIRPDYEAPCQLASIQSLLNRLEQVPVPDVIVCDEFHHARSKTWETVLATNPQAFILALTATPQRLDGKGLGKMADAMVVGPTMRELIDQGYLADFVIYAPPAPDLKDVHTVAGDYNQEELAAAIDKPQIVGDVVDHYRKHADGTQAICFAVNRLHSRHLVEAFNQAGIRAKHVDAETPKIERALAFEDFAKRRFRVLSNVEIAGEGVDIAGIEAVICARPTKSLTLALQQWGRGLRVKPDGRKCIILDHAGNVFRHGLPDDPREWTLTADRIKRAGPTVEITTCPGCFAVVPAATVVCPQCGFQIQQERPASRGGPEFVEGELDAIDPAEWRRRRAIERARAGTLEELIALGEARGYKRGWAYRVWAHRGGGTRANRRVRTS